MKKRSFFFLLLFSFSVFARADEGMWLPVLLDQLNITDMHARGFKLSADDIYSVNHSSMKDAVCQFGGGCTAELISAQGLLLTNHHCGFGAIQSHSTVNNDYVTNGYWAKSKAEELPCPGLTVTFIVSMENVTAKILTGVSDAMSGASRDSIILKNSGVMEKENTKDGYDAFVRGFYYGNEFYMFITQTFKDVRLVGAPPYAIGDFGGDSDNWVWPRQTGDFSMFRIYADKNNNPAEYSADNIPYVPKYFFKINANGIDENDFTMVFGFPGRTSEYLSSYGVDLVANVSDPVKVDLRTQRIHIMEQRMANNDTVRIKYAVKRNGTANAWKKWEGEMQGLKNTHAIDLKKKYEDDFSKRVAADPVKQKKYGSLLPDLQKAYTDIIPYQRSIDYMSEGCFTVELLRFAQSFTKLVTLSTTPSSKQEDINKQIAALKAGVNSFFMNYDYSTDKQIATAMFSSDAKGMDFLYQPPVLVGLEKKYNNDFGKYFDMLFSKTIFTKQAKLMEMLNNWNSSAAKKIAKDPAYALMADLLDFYENKLLPEWQKRNTAINELNRTYMQAQMDVFPEKKFYPDANSTLRVAYGKIDGYSPRDGVSYSWYTTLDGVMQKEDSTNMDYLVPAKLKQLWLKKDYGSYADKKDGKIHTCFIATNHTTGGNSGSPVLDANGNLIGTNFDRCWEGTMSDINFDPSLCRNIILDVRYTLFIIDKYAGAGYLLKEMVFVQ